MRLGEFLKQDLIMLDIEAADKWEAIEELIDVLVAGHEIKASDRNHALELVMAREQSMSTGIGKGVGIPHATVNFLPHVVGAYARLKRPIEYEAIDGEPVQHLVLMLIPKSEYQQHVKTLAGIARMMNEQKVRDHLLAGASSEEVLNIIQQAEVV